MAETVVRPLLFVARNTGRLKYVKTIYFKTVADPIDFQFRVQQTAYDVQRERSSFDI